MTERMGEEEYEAEKRKAINTAEDALRRQAEVYAHSDSQEAVDRHEQMFMQAWVGVSSWTGVTPEGYPSSKVVCHLNDYELPPWQIIGLLRAALIQAEQSYATKLDDGEDES